MAPVAVPVVLLLMALLGTGGADVSCPEGCGCTAATLNCSRIVGSPRMERVPVPKSGEIFHFRYLDFTGNAISYIGEEIWQFYTLALHVNLKGNRLTGLQTSSLKGLTLVTHLDFSCNDIQNVGKNAFEEVPFLQSVNLSGNAIEEVPDGTFKAWHGMQNLSVVDLNNNPLTILQDTYLYELPSLKFLDLAATKIKLEVLASLLQTALALRTLIVTRQISCCLCQMKDNVEDLCDTVELQCTGSCTIEETWCENQKPWSKMQEEVLKALETRKVNGSSLLKIIPGRTVTSIETSLPAPTLSSSAVTFTISDFLKRLIEQKAREMLDVNWDDKSQLENLYLLVRVLEASLKEKILEADKESSEVAVQEELPAQLSVMSIDEASEESLDASSRSRVGRDGRAIAKATMSSREQRSILQLPNEDQTRRKLPESVEPQRVLSFPQPRQFAQTLTKGKLLYQLLKRSQPPVEDDTSHISAIDSDPSLNALSPDMTSHGTSQEDHYQQASRFEDEVNKQLMPLIPNTPLRELISHLIRVLKMECVEPTARMTCSAVSSRTGLLLKLISDRQNINEPSLLFWLSKNATTASSRELKKGPDHEVAGSKYKKVLWAAVVTLIIAVIIAVICVIEIMSRRSAGKLDAQERTFLGRKKESLPDEESPRTGSFTRDNPLWLQDTFELVDEIKSPDMVGSLHSQETVEEQTTKKPSQESARTPYEPPPSEAAPPLPPAAPPPPPPPPPESKQAPASEAGGTEYGGTKAASTAADTEEATEDDGGGDDEAGDNEDEDEDEDEEDEDD